MIRKTYDILYSVLELFKGDDFGICSNISVRDLFPDIDSDYWLEDSWLFFRSSYNEVFYYTGVPCDLVFKVACAPDKFIYFYRLE